MKAGNVGERERQVLRAVVENHIENPAPVASRTLSRNELSDLNLSPATIRNILADLDDRGYVAQPHTSAGRVPTDKGYRFYVEELMTARTPSPREKMMINSGLECGRGQSADIMRITSELLVRFSHQAGIVIFPRLADEPVRSFHFIRISASQIQVVLVTEGEGVRNVLIDTDEDYAERELAELANFINHRFSGKTLKQIRVELRRQTATDEARADLLRQRALKIQERLAAQGALPELLVDGVPDLLGAPEFRNDVNRLHKILKLLSDKRKLLSILDKCFENGKKGVVVEIGKEFEQDAGIDDCALVVRSRGGVDGWDGAIGVIGPRRMNYRHVVGLVDYFSASLDNLLAGEER